MSRPLDQVASGDRPDSSHETLTLPQVSDDLVRRAIEVIGRTGLLALIETWEREARKGPGGRHRTLTLRALLVGLLVVARLGEPAHLKRVHKLLFYRVSPEIRAELGVPNPPAPRDWRRQLATYRNVRTRFHGLLALMDPSDRPKNRRLTDDSFMALFEEKAAQRSDADREEAYERLTLFINLLLEASFLMLPREYRKSWNGGVSVDATVIPAFARPERRAKERNKSWQDRKVLRRSTDPDCGYYSRSNDDRDDDTEPQSPKKLIWGYEASLVVLAHVEAAGDPPLPVLAMAMPPLHVPGREPGRNATRALKNLREERGHPAGYLSADNAYSAAKSEDFQLPARALGYDLVLTYRIDQLGIQGESNGFLLVEGRWYCPAMPEPLIQATLDWRQGLIDEEMHHKRIEARRTFEAKPKGKSFDGGHQRYSCPASQGAPTAWCELKPKTDTRLENLNQELRKRIRPTEELKARPPKCCSQESVTIPPAAGAKSFQSLPLGTDEHHVRFSGQRNAVEGFNGFLKDSAEEGVANPQRRRIRGQAAQSVLVAFQIVAANLRKIDSFLEKMAALVDAPRASRRRRRATNPIGSGLIASGPRTTDGRSPPLAPI